MRSGGVISARRDAPWQAGNMPGVQTQPSKVLHRLGSAVDSIRKLASHWIKQASKGDKLHGQRRPHWPGFLKDLKGNCC